MSKVVCPEVYGYCIQNSTEDLLLYLQWPILKKLCNCYMIKLSINKNKHVTYLQEEL